MPSPLAVTAKGTATPVRLGRVSRQAHAKGSSGLALADVAESPGSLPLLLLGGACVKTGRAPAVGADHAEAAACACAVGAGDDPADLDTDRVFGGIADCWHSCGCGDAPDSSRMI